MMKITALLLALLSSAAAFAPASTSTRPATSLNAWINETPVGVTKPVGFFDPLGLSKGKSDSVVKYYRESELKHGRVAMAACLGWFITAGGTHPAFNGSLSDNPLKAATELPFVGWLQFFLGCGAIEWLTEKIREKPGYKPGDILGSAYWVDDSDDLWVAYQNRELNNGRLAMLAIAGMWTQTVLFGDYGDELFRPLVT